MEDMETVVDGPVPEQLPVRPHLRCRDDRDLGLALGAPAASDQAVLLCRNAILLSLYEAMTVGCVAIHYSRNTNTYWFGRKKLPEYWTYRKVKRAIEELTTTVPVLIEHRAPQKPPRALGFTPRQSTLAAGPAFKIDAALDAFLAAQAEPGARIRLRDARKREKPVPAAHPIVSVTKSFQARFDEAVRNARLEVLDPRITWVSDTIGYMTAGRGKVRIDLGRRYPVRIFTRDMRSGGRWYHGSWAEMPSQLRKTMRMDGAAVVERDFSACHLRLAYYAAGAADALAAFGANDLYTLPTFDKSWRPAIKLTVVIMLNAKHLDAARRALARDIDPALLAQRTGAVDELLAGIKAAHPAIARFWHSNCGIGLQFVDSEIVRIAIERLLDHGVLALPVHDSLIVAAEHENLLVEVMEHTFETDGQRIALQRFAGKRRKPRQAGLRVRDLTNGRAGAQGLEQSGPQGKGLSQASVSDVVTGLSSCSGDVEASWRELKGEPAAILSDLSALLAARGAWSKPIIRAVLHQLATSPANRASMRSAFHSWQLKLHTPGLAPPAFLRAELDRFCVGSRRRPTAATVVRHCNIQPAEAARLKLAVLRPTPRGPHRQAIAKRGHRMAHGLLPIIVPVKPVKPWLDTLESRSAWYARTTEVERQVLALQSLVRSGDHSALDRSAKAIAKAKEARQAAGPSPLPVDYLLAQLDAVMALAARTSDVVLQLGTNFSSVATFAATLTEAAGVAAQEQVPVAANVGHRVRDLSTGIIAAGLDTVSHFFRRRS